MKRNNLYMSRIAVIVPVLILCLIPGTYLSAQSAPADMARINGGTFMMGSPESEAEISSYGEQQREITVSSFYMGIYEVTQKEYVELMRRNPSDFKGDNLPVECVRWFDAVEYCNRRSINENLTPAYTIDGSDVTWNRDANGYRLPTEAEWEYACRAGTTSPFSTGGNITSSQANYDGNYPYNGNVEGIYREKTTEAGTFAPNAWGLYDMHGNVAEWCWDWNFGSAVRGRRNLATVDPVGEETGTHRLVRGGSWDHTANYLRSAHRSATSPGVRSKNTGFRVARNN